MAMHRNGQNLLSFKTFRRQETWINTTENRRQRTHRIRVNKKQERSDSVRLPRRARLSRPRARLPRALRTLRAGAGGRTSAPWTFLGLRIFRVYVPSSGCHGRTSLSLSFSRSSCLMKILEERDATRRIGLRRLIAPSQPPLSEPDPRGDLPPRPLRPRSHFPEDKQGKER